MSSPAQPATPVQIVWSRVAAIPYPAYLLLAATLAASITLVFFCPNFSRWPKIYVAGGAGYPETVRAVDALRQLDDPFVRIELATNRVMQWRLLFPLLGHYLRLPPHVYLALPHVGCLAALIAIIHFACRELRDRLSAFFVGMLSAGCNWFFVSTGWLSYNDSWIMLGLVTVAFTRSPYALTAAALCCPWIDERFLLLLPVCLGLRSHLLADRPFSGLLRDCCLALAGVVPYLIIRTVAHLSGSDSVATAYLDRASSDWPAAWQVLVGGWSGLRSLWVYAAIFPWLAFRSRIWPWNVAFLLATAAILIVSFLVAADISRSISAFLPIPLAGVVLLHRNYASICNASLPIVAVVNLLLPASHLITTFQVPISGVWAELTRREPSAEEYNQQGVRLLNEDRVEEALLAFSSAVRIDPEHSRARTNRAMMFVASGEFQAALDDLNVVIQRDNHLADALYLRGICLESLGDSSKAIQDYQRALAEAPANWQPRDDVHNRLKRLQSRPAAVP